MSTLGRIAFDCDVEQVKEARRLTARRMRELRKLAFMGFTFAERRRTIHMLGLKRYYQVRRRQTQYR